MRRRRRIFADRSYAFPKFGNDPLGDYGLNAVVETVEAPPLNKADREKLLVCLKVNTSESGGGGGGGPTISLAANRTTGVAPLSVHFDATGTTSPATTRPFHGLHYRWNFDDPNDTAYKTGGIAAHVFDQPGTYDVELQVTAADGSTSTETVQITVTDPDVVFSGTNTVVVSNGTDFTGKPTGATEVTSSDFDATIATHLAAGKRVLFKRGDTFTISTQVQINDSGAPSMIGAWGTPGTADARGILDNAPVVEVDYDGTTIAIGSGGTSSDLRIVGLNFQFVHASGVPGSLFGEDSAITNLLVYQCQSDIARDFVNLSGSSGFHTGICIANCDTADHNRYGVFLSGTDIAVLNSNIPLATPDVATNEHVFRCAWATRLVLSGNVLTSARQDKHIVKVHAEPHVDSSDDSQFVLISDNEIIGDDAAVWLISVGTSSGTRDERVYDIVIERNEIEFVGTGGFACAIDGFDCTVRNNTLSLDATVPAGHEAYLLYTENRGAAGGLPDPFGHEVYHNTVHTTNSTMAKVVVASGNDHVGDVVVRNNLLYCPNTTSTSTLTSGSGNTYATSGNLVGTDPLFVSSSDWHLQSGSPAIGVGVAVPVRDEFVVTHRTARDLTNPDAGAYEFGAVESGEPGGGGGGGGGGYTVYVEGRVDLTADWEILATAEVPNESGAILEVPPVPYLRLRADLTTEGAVMAHLVA